MNSGVMNTSKVADVALRKERHAELIKAATKLFLERGFYKTTTREIATALGWQPGKLYLYISRKEDILYLMLSDIAEQLLDAILSVERRPTARMTIVAIADSYFGTVHRLRRELNLVYRETYALEMDQRIPWKNGELRGREIISEVIQWGIKNDEFKPVNTILFAHDFIMLAHMWALKLWVLRDEIDIESYKTQQIGILLSSITSDDRAGIQST
jgi:AcrR family transcriptional regulator